MKIRSSINLPLGHARFHQKIGPGRFSRNLIWRSLLNNKVAYSRWAPSTGNCRLLSINKICLWRHSRLYNQWLHMRFLSIYLRRQHVQYNTLALYSTMHYTTLLCIIIYFRYIQPLCLPVGKHSNQLFTNYLPLALGWGTTHYDGEVNISLQPDPM